MASRDHAPTTDAVTSGQGHTPGPWEIEPNTARGAWIKGSTGEWAAISCGDSDPSALANARLIAAAPELLEALRAAKREMWFSARHSWTFEDFKNWAVVQQIDAALAKAEGR